MAATVLPLPQGEASDAGESHLALSGDGDSARAPAEDGVTGGAPAEAILASSRGALAFLSWSGRAALSAAAGFTRLPLVGPSLSELNRRTLAERSILTRRFEAFARKSVSSLVGAVVGGLDLTSIVIEGVDIDRVVDQVDVERILARVDVDGVVARADLDLILARIDIVAIAQEVIEELDLPKMIRDSSGTLAAETLEDLRLQGMQADHLVSQVVDRVLFRKGTRRSPPLEPPGRKGALAGT